MFSKHFTNWFKVLTVYFNSFKQSTVLARINTSKKTISSRNLSSLTYGGGPFEFSTHFTHGNIGCSGPAIHYKRATLRYVQQTRKTKKFSGFYFMSPARNIIVLLGGMNVVIKFWANTNFTRLGLIGHHEITSVFVRAALHLVMTSSGFEVSNSERKTTTGCGYLCFEIKAFV